MKRTKKTEKSMVKTEEKLRGTSMMMPVDLWQATHIRAIQEGKDFREIIWDALRAYLKTPVKRQS